MSLRIEGQKCVVCGAYLFEEDDVVYCPDCGAPHHRDCYATVGRCGMEAFHGTDQAYKRPEMKDEMPEPDKPENPAGSVCPRCGRETDSDTKFCPYCGTPLTGVPFADTGSVGSDELEEGVTAGKAARVVMANVIRYIPLFRTLGKNKKVSWNWAAFLLPHGWFGFRKMYLPCAIVSALMVVAGLFLLPMMYQLETLSGSDSLSYAELYSLLGSGAAGISRIAMMLSGIGSLLNLGVRIVSALFGDWIYRQRVVSAVREIDENDGDEELARRRSGISPAVFLVAIILVQVLPVLIFNFIG